MPSGTLTAENPTSTDYTPDASANHIVQIQKLHSSPCTIMLEVSGPDHGYQGWKVLLGGVHNFWLSSGVAYRLRLVASDSADQVAWRIEP